jgi:hypothetical protein
MEMDKQGLGKNLEEREDGSVGTLGERCRHYRAPTRLREGRRIEMIGGVHGNLARDNRNGGANAVHD